MNKERANLSFAMFRLTLDTQLHLPKPTDTERNEIPISPQKYQESFHCAANIVCSILFGMTSYFCEVGMHSLLACVTPKYTTITLTTPLIRNVYGDTGHAGKTVQRSAGFVYHVPAAGSCLALVYTPKR